MEIPLGRIRKPGLSYFNFSNFLGGACPQTSPPLQIGDAFNVTMDDYAVKTLTLKQEINLKVLQVFKYPLNNTLKLRKFIPHLRDLEDVGIQSGAPNGIFR